MRAQTEMATTKSQYKNTSKGDKSQAVRQSCDVCVKHSLRCPQMSCSGDIGERMNKISADTIRLMVMDKGAASAII